MEKCAAEPGCTPEQNGEASIEKEGTDCAISHNNVACKKRRVEHLVLPDWLHKSVLFEHMAPSELYACKKYLPLDDYVHYLEMVSKANQQSIPGAPRSSWTSTVSK